MSSSASTNDLGERPTKERKRLSLRGLRRRKTESDGSQSKEKSKSFKRIRGFLSGESRRERRARRAAARAARGNTDDGSQACGEDEEDDTVYGVDIQSTGTRESKMLAEEKEKRAPVEAAPETEEKEEEPEIVEEEVPILLSSLQIILLLMDPVTRRFELLQLEFDSNKAVVNDVLAQVPHSVTEEALRMKDYTGICDRYGTELGRTKHLSELCEAGAEIFIGIPEGVGSGDCVRLARPILADGNVIELLKISGIDIGGLVEEPEEERLQEEKEVFPDDQHAPKPDPEPTLDPTREIAIKVETPPVKKSSSWGGVLWFSIGFLALMAVGLQIAHQLLSTPLSTGQVLSPGSWKVRCGIFAPLPSCEFAALQMKSDGVLTFYGSDHKEGWEIQGAVCSEKDPNCIKGAVLKEDGYLYIGGMQATSMTTYGRPAVLEPWPFDVTPNLENNARK